MNWTKEQLCEFRHSLQSGNLVPPKELYQAYLQFWRRPDEEDISGQTPIRYCVSIDYDERGCVQQCLVVKMKGDDCWSWTPWCNQFLVQMKQSPQHYELVVSATTAVMLAMNSSRSRDLNFNSSVFLQRIPTRLETSAGLKWYEGTVYRVDAAGVYEVDATSGEYTKLVRRFDSGWTDNGRCFSLKDECREIYHFDEESLRQVRVPRYRFVSKGDVSFIRKAMLGEAEYRINSTIGIAYAIVDGKLMRWQDDDFTLPMSRGESQLVVRGESLRVSRGEASAYMMCYDDMYIEKMIDYWNEM